MAVLQAYKILWATGTVFVLLPHLNMGLLSDYKICGDSECESPMSRVQAIKDHHGKDCRFLNFKRGDTISVYHKLTGKREDLWAGSIDKHFGYFPKDAVQEEQIYATVEKIVETQESDFFCMDEFGSIIDSSHLDGDDDDDVDEQIQNQESETTQTTPHTDETIVESPSTSADVSTEPPAPAQEADSTLTEEDESKNTSDAATATHAEEQEAPKEQGLSASSPWLSSSVTGWLGLSTGEEEPGNLAEGEVKDERKETQAEEASFASSVTGWLGLGGEGKPDDAVEGAEEEDRESADSFTSSMTGWLSFRGEKKTNQPAEKEEEREKDKEQEPAETFRSRRMSLDLEGSQLHEEEKEETGTLGWLGNGLSNTLGFGWTNQEPEREAEETIQEEEEQPASSSWFDMGVGDILGYGKDKSEVGESTGSGFKETEEQTTGSESVDTSQSQPALTEEVKTETNNESKMEEDISVPSDMETVPGNNIRDMGTSDSSKDSVLPEDAAFKVDQMTSLEEKSQAVSGMSSMLNSFFQTDSEEEKEDNILDDKQKETDALDGDRSAEMEGKDHQMPESIENMNEDNIREPGEEEMKNASDTDQVFLTQSDTDLGPDLSSGQSVGEVEEDKTEDMVEQRAQVLDQTDDTQESTETSAKIGASGDDHKAEENDAEIDHRDILTTHTEGGTSGTAEERNEPVSNLTAHSEEASVDKSDSSACTEAKTRQGELGQEVEVHPVQGSSQEFGSPHSADGSTEIVSKNASAEDRRTFPISESTTQMEDDADQDSKSPQQSDGDAQDTETEELKEGENQMEIEELKEEGTQEELQEVKEKKTQEKQQESEEEIEELEKEKVEELTEKRKHGEVEEIKEVDNQGEVRELKEEKAQGEEEELKEEKKKPEIEEITEKEKKQGEVDELKGAEKQEAVEELMEGRKQEEEHSQEEGNQVEDVELKEEGGKDKMEEKNEEKKQEDVDELKEEEQQQQIEELKEKKQEEMEQFKEERVEELKEVEEEKKEGEEVQSSHFDAKMENSLHSSPHQQKDIGRPESDSNETQDENSLEFVLSETSEQTEKREAEKPHMEEENGEEEVKEIEEIGNDSVNRSSSIDEGEIETMTDSDQILADMTGESQMALSEGMERGEDRKQEEEKRTNEGQEEQGEKKDSESDTPVNEDVRSDHANNISDLNALGVNQISDTDLLYSGESGQNSHPGHIFVDQTAESKEDDQLYSVEAKNTDFSDHDMLRKGDNTKLEDSEASSYGISTEQLPSEVKINTEEDTDGEKREINVKHDDVRVNENDGNTAEFRAEGGTESSVSSGDPVISEQAAPQVSQHPTGSSLLSDGHNKGIAQTESGGALGLFKNVFSYFNQKPATEPTESAPNLDSNTGETPEAQESLTPEQDSTADSTEVYVQDLHTDSPTAQSQEQLQPSPPPFIQAASPSSTQSHYHPSSLSPNTKTLTKHYKNLLVHMSPDETTILTEVVGRHKLQFLDYILGSSETMTEDPEHDESILSDIERLLHHHRETLVIPSMRLVDAPQEDKDRTKTLIALQKLEMLLARLREIFNTRKSDISNTNLQAKSSKDKEITSEEESRKMGDSSAGLDNITPRDEWMGVDKEKAGQLNGGTGKEGESEHKKKGKNEKSSEEERVSPDLPQTLEGPGLMKQMWDFAHQIAEDSTTHVLAARELLIWLTVQVVSSLPDDIRPGPDLYGVPWEPVIFTSLVGLMTMLLFTCRCYSSVKSRMYRSRERWMAEQITQLLDEKCKVLETLSKCQQEHDDLESSLRDSGVLAQTQKTEHLEGKARQLGHAKRELERDLEQLKDQLEQQREHRIEQERRIAELEENMKTFEEETKDLRSQDEQAQTTLKVYNMNSDRLQRNLETAGEENTLLQESNTQLRQQVEGWAERVSELEAEMSRYEAAHSGMLQDVANKDERIMSLTDRLLRMKAWDSDLEEEGGEEGGEKETSNGTAGRGEENGRGDKVDTQNHLQKVQKLIYAAKLNADLKSVDEDKDRAFAKLNDEVKAKDDLQVSIKEMENEKLSLQADTEHYSEQVQKIQQKLQIMTEMYQENELKLHRLLTVEEKERLQKEEKLNKADKNIALAIEELNNYRQRAEEMEEELEKTKQSYQTQISAHEKKAHNNWLAARAADRELADIRRENSLLRQKLTDTQFKLDTTDKDPYALDSLARPLPFRAERSPYGPSPLGRPASETRAFLSPPTLMDGPPARLSPRVPRGPGEPPGGQGEMERSGGPHSDSGSISPTWERDRRGPPPGPPGPLGPPGYMFPEPGGPMYRRPPPPPGPMGFLPPPGSLPPGHLHPRGLPPGPPHPADMADGPYRENSLGPGELEHRESGPGDRRTPPEADPRMGGPPSLGPPMGPIDGPFPRRAPYGPPPPDFFPPRGPGGPPMMPMWAPPPPGVMFPPRFPAGGPPLPPPPHPHHAPHMRPPLTDGLPPPSMGPPLPQQPLPPHSQSPEERTASPEDAI